MKNKILSSVLIGCGVATIPLSAITVVSSCSKETPFVGNLMTESQPTVDPVAAELFADCSDPDDVKDLYINRTQALKDGFRQDLVYTMSRGLSNYNSFLNECGVKIGSQNFDIRINQIEPKPNRTISFVGTMIIKYDYSESTNEALAAAGINFPKMDETINLKMVLDLDTSKDAGFTSVDAKYRQLTATQENAIEIGVSEINSTIEVYEEGVEHEAYHFIEPQKDYWESIGKATEYDERMVEISTLKEMGLYTPIELLNHYLSAEAYPIANTPNTLELGSYYFQNMELNDALEIYRMGNNVVCNGYNISNKITTSIRKLEESQWFIDDTTLNMPKYDASQNRIHSLANNSFMENTNRGLPDTIEKLIVSNNYQTIGSNSIACNSDENVVQTLVFDKIDEYGDTIPSISRNAFGKMLNLDCIDFSKYDKSDSSQISSKWVNAFAKIHEGWIGQTPNEGVIIIPKDALIESWAGALMSAGLNIKDYSATDTSWTIITSPN